MNIKYVNEYNNSLKISELIKELQKIKKQYGDLPVSTEEILISPKYRPKAHGKEIFPLIKIGHMEYWNKKSPKIAIIENYDWSLLEEDELEE